MSQLLEQREDGSLSLYINGDLQFDSRDERVYHEALGLPAVAVAELRHGGNLNALICGGGDGLVAREVLKSRSVATVTLVDYDSSIVAIAREELSELNEHSLSNPRLTVHIEDAWQYCIDRKNGHETYQLLLCDLTVPQDVESARLHSIEWYALLKELVAPGGILAVNAASPSQTPDAYWSIYNSMRQAGWSPRPFRIALPSFTACGYGQDWGFFLASDVEITSRELDALKLPEPRQQLKEVEHLKRLFLFPPEVAARRKHARPASAGSDLLLHYLHNPTPSGDPCSVEWNALESDDGQQPLLEPVRANTFFPPALRSELEHLPENPVDAEGLFKRITEIMPALKSFQTREMISDFLCDPGRFLKAIDLRALVNSLLKRAAELPAKFVDDLHHLRENLSSFFSDTDRLLRLGSRMLTIITLVVILGNLIYPDSVYGKGEYGGYGSVSTDSWSLSRPAHTSFDTVMAPPELASGGGFRGRAIGKSVLVDEMGSVYPGRRYRYYSRGYYCGYRRGQRVREQPQNTLAVYRLTPEADILPDGQVAIMLTDTAYMILGDHQNTITDNWTADPVLQVATDPAQLWRVAREIERQQLGLKQSAGAKRAWIAWMDWLGFAPWRDDDLVELKNLDEMTGRLETARKALGEIPNQAPALPPLTVPGAIELFCSAWMSADGKYLSVRLPDGTIAFMDGNGWYSDLKLTKKLKQPYPVNFKKVVAAYLSNESKNRTALFDRLKQSKLDASQDLEALLRDKADYNLCQSDTKPSENVDYGTTQIPLSEAIERTDDDIERTEQRLQLIDRQMSNWPYELSACDSLLKTLKT